MDFFNQIRYERVQNAIERLIDGRLGWGIGILLVTSLWKRRKSGTWLHTSSILRMPESRPSSKSAVR